MSGRLKAWGAVWAVATVAAALLVDPIVAAFVGILGLAGWGVAYLASDWERHPGFEEREQDRALRRAAHRERTKDARARDRARWERYQARQAEKRARGTG